VLQARKEARKRAHPVRNGGSNKTDRAANRLLNECLGALKSVKNEIAPKVQTLTSSQKVENNTVF
jgi:hypothetical protein